MAKIATKTNTKNQPQTTTKESTGDSEHGPKNPPT
jgi:hypothetical protein